MAEEMRTVAVRLNSDDQELLERWKKVCMADTDTQAIRTALRWLERHEERMQNENSSVKS